MNGQRHRKSGKDGQTEEVNNSLWARVDFHKNIITRSVGSFLPNADFPKHVVT